MALPLMPKATAVWLIENTKLTFEQIAEFCGMHPLEVQGIADGEVAVGIIGQDPVTSGQLDGELLKRAEKDANVSITLAPEVNKYLSSKKAKGGRYTPVARRQDKPDAISWILKNHPYIPEAQIVKLLGTTKNTIASVKERSHWNSSNIKPRDPVLLGLCTQTNLDNVVTRYRPADAPESKEAQG